MAGSCLSAPPTANRGHFFPKERNLVKLTNNIGQIASSSFLLAYPKHLSQFYSVEVHQLVLNPDADGGKRLYAITVLVGDLNSSFRAPHSSLSTLYTSSHL